MSDQDRQQMVERIRELEDALKFYAGHSGDSTWNDNRFIAIDKFGCVDELASGPLVAIQALYKNGIPPLEVGSRAQWQGVEGAITRTAIRPHGIQIRWIADSPAQLRAKAKELGMLPPAMGLFFELDGSPSRYAYDNKYPLEPVS